MKRLHYIHQVNSGQGVARNRGVKEAKGDIILFIGDDILVEPDFLKNHQKTHDLYPDVTVAVLGHSTWDPALQINDYMRFLESSGWQFGYEFLTPGFVKHSQPYKFFYTSNISLKKELFEKEQFDEQFRSYGWEDIEWAFRLWKKHGLKVFYEPKAKAYHHHFIPESDLPKRMQKVGQSAVLCQKLQPEIQIMPTGLKAYLIKLATNPITLPLTRLLGKNTYFKFCSWREFFVGMKG